MSDVARKRPVQREASMNGLRTHGHTYPRHSLTYRIWSGMRTRTTNPNHHSSRLYLGRGIDYDPRWEHFENFLGDMGECPEGLSLDRIDNDKGYWPDNCRWATRAQQIRNTSRNIWVFLDGERMVMKDALRILGYTEQAVWYLRKNHTITDQEIIDRFSKRRKALGSYESGAPIHGRP